MILLLKNIEIYKMNCEFTVMKVILFWSYFSVFLYPPPP